MKINIDDIKNLNDDNKDSEEELNKVPLTPEEKLEIRKKLFFLLMLTIIVMIILLGILIFKPIKLPKKAPKLLPDFSLPTKKEPLKNGELDINNSEVKNIIEMSNLSIISINYFNFFAIKDSYLVKDMTSQEKMFLFGQSSSLKKYLLKEKKLFDCEQKTIIAEKTINKLYQEVFNEEKPTNESFIVLSGKVNNLLPIKFDYQDNYYISNCNVSQNDKEGYYTQIVKAIKNDNEIIVDLEVTKIDDTMNILNLEKPKDKISKMYQFVFIKNNDQYQLNEIRGKK